MRSSPKITVFFWSFFCIFLVTTSFTLTMTLTTSANFSSVTLNTAATQLDCNYAQNIPTIDGHFLTSEWSDASHYTFFFVPEGAYPADNIDIFVKYNATHLFICYDVQPDNTTNSDLGFLYLDLDNNGITDFRFLAARSGYRSAYQYGAIQNECTNLNWKLVFGFETTPQEIRNHTVIEWLINIDVTTNYQAQNLSNANALPFGVSPIGILFAGYGSMFPNWLYGNYTAVNPSSVEGSTDASFYADFTLKAPSAGEIPGFESFFLGVSLLILLGMYFLIKKKPLYL